MRFRLSNRRAASSNRRIGLGFGCRDVDVVRTVLADAFKFRPARRTGFLYRRWAPLRYRRVGHDCSVCLGPLMLLAVQFDRFLILPVWGWPLAAEEAKGIQIEVARFVC